jgi:urea carboxylase-associated protein 2
MTLSPETMAAIAANRRRYEELKAAGQDHAPAALPALAPLPGPSLPEDALLHRDTIPGGWYWTRVLRRGQRLRIVNTAGSPGVSALLWRLDDTSERYNAADTIKIQWTAAIRKGRVLFSDMGRVMASLVEDSCGQHDTVVGASTPASVAARYPGRAARNSRDNFRLAAGKHGMGPRDVPPCITFFAGLRADGQGRLSWVPGCTRPGDFVELRAEMDLIVALSNCPHPLAPGDDPAPGPVEVLVCRAGAEPPDDPCRTATAEARRGFENLVALLDA